MKKLLLILFLTVSPTIISAQSGYIEVTAPGNRHLRLAVEPARLLDMTTGATPSQMVADVIFFGAWLQKRLRLKHDL